MRANWRLVLVGVPLLLVSCEAERSAPTGPDRASFAKAPASKLKVDQSNSVSDGLGLGNGLYGQTYVPGAKNLAQVDLLLQINLLTAGVTTTVGVFTDITQPPLATTSTLIAPAAPGELNRVVSFAFDPPVPLVKGASYTLGLYAPFNVSWEFAFGDAYPAGQVVHSDGSPLNPTADFVFTTYSSK